jgi:hypothetical protein
MRHVSGPTSVAFIAVYAAAAAACATGASGPAARSEPEKLPTLRPEPTSAPPGQDPVGRDWFWPTRACTNRPDTVVLETDCTCGDALLCTAHVHDGVIDLHTTGGQRTCKDCRVGSVRCTLPVLARPRGPEGAAFAVSLNGAPLIDQLAIRPTGQVNLASCAR